MHFLVTAVLVASLPSAAPSEPERRDGAPLAQVAPRDGAAPTVVVVEEPRAKLLGVQLSAGAPQGFALSAVVRPLPWLRGTLGFAHNIIGPGIQGSLTAMPFRGVVTPTFTLEAGHFFDTDASDELSELPRFYDPALQDFGYQFYSAQLGLELGSQRGFVFFLRAGLAWMRSGLDRVEGFRPEGSTTTVDASGLDLRATVPTVNLGFTAFVW